MNELLNYKRTKFYFFNKKDNRDELQDFYDKFTLIKDRHIYSEESGLIIPTSWLHELAVEFECEETSICDKDCMKSQLKINKQYFCNSKYNYFTCQTDDVRPKMICFMQSLVATYNEDFNADIHIAYMLIDTDTDTFVKSDNSESIIPAEYYIGIMTDQHVCLNMTVGNVSELCVYLKYSLKEDSFNIDPQSTWEELEKQMEGNQYFYMHRLVPASEIHNDFL